MATKSYRSAQELGNAFRETVEVIMDEVYERLLNHLLEIIERDVYGVEEPIFYERTYDLMNPQNWEVKKWKYGGKIMREIYFKNENLSRPTHGDSHDPSNYIHNEFKGTFNPNAFLQLLNNEIPQGDAFNFRHPSRKPFWDDFEQYCERYYRMLLMNACKRHGMVIY